MSPSTSLRVTERRQRLRVLLVLNSKSFITESTLRRFSAVHEEAKCWHRTTFSLWPPHGCVMDPQLAVMDICPSAIPLAQTILSCRSLGGTLLVQSGKLRAALATLTANPFLRMSMSLMDQTTNNT